MNTKTHTKKIKPSTKKLNKLVLDVFPLAVLDNSILFEEFHFMLSDIESDLKPLYSNQNWLIGSNTDNIFLITITDEEKYIQKLENQLTFDIPKGFIHPDFSNLVKLNFKNFTSYLLFDSLKKKLPEKNSHSFSKI